MRMRILSFAVMAAIAALPAAAQATEQMHQIQSRQDRQARGLSCDNSNDNGRQFRHCEMREQQTGFAGRLSVDAGMNGGVTVKGWDQSGVLVRAKIEGWADDESTAK